MKMKLVTGYGFKLKNPLERPSIVEVYCDHSVNTNSDAMELFPHIASFVDTKVFTIQSDTDSNIFTTDGEYELGNNQLEVWLNGVLLIHRIYSVSLKQMKLLLQPMILEH